MDSSWIDNRWACLITLRYFVTVWVVRAGRYGERDALDLEKGVITVGWDSIPDLSGIASRKKLEELCRKIDPQARPSTIGNQVAQLWAFRKGMRTNDLVVLPLKTRSTIAIGYIVGPYQYHSDFPADAQHVRPVNWIRTDLPRTAFDRDLLYSFGGQKTVYKVQRNSAEKRLISLLEAEAGIGGEKEVHEQNKTLDRKDQVLVYRTEERVGRGVPKHNLRRLVKNLLTSQGYSILTSHAKSGPGIFIVVGHDPIGFESHICVEVKSGNLPVGSNALKRLQGEVNSLGVDGGLLVASAGFKRNVAKEAHQYFPKIRLWDASDLTKRLLDNYSRLPATDQAELHLTFEPYLKMVIRTTKLGSDVNARHQTPEL